MTSAVRSAADWFEDNEEGLRLAADGGWGDASLAFEVAVRRLTASAPAEPETHEALALVLGNLANACYRAGRVEDAIAHGQRACALREALAGDDAMTVARMRSDLAVMLASAGRTDEAPALLDRAIAAIERTAGDEDAGLAPVLENAARAALLLGQPSNAEPVLLRLHALLDAHGQDTSVAERLLAEVASTRATPPALTPTSSAATAPSHDEVEPAPPSVEWGGEADQDEAESDDQPLRDAVRLTDALLRTTPSGVPAIRDDALSPMPHAEPAPTADATADALATADAAADVPMEDAAAPVSEADDATATSALEDFGGELELVPLREPQPATPQPAAAADASPPVPAKAGLGFEVQYGVPLDSDPMEQSLPRAGMSAGSAPPIPPQVDAAPDPMGDLELIDVSSDVSSDASAGFASSASPTVSASPRPAPVVLPNAEGGQSMSRATTNDDRELAALRSKLVEAPAGGAAPRRAPRVAGGEVKPKGRGAAIGGLVGLAAAAAAGWFLFRGGFF